MPETSSNLTSDKRAFPPHVHSSSQSIVGASKLGAGQSGNGACLEHKLSTNKSTASAAGSTKSSSHQQARHAAIASTTSSNKNKTSSSTFGAVAEVIKEAAKASYLSHASKLAPVGDSSNHAKIAHAHFSKKSLINDNYFNKVISSSLTTSTTAALSAANSPNESKIIGSINIRNNKFILTDKDSKKSSSSQERQQQQQQQPHNNIPKYYRQSPAKESQEADAAKARSAARATGSAITDSSSRSSRNRPVSAKKQQKESTKNFENTAENSTNSSNTIQQKSDNNLLTFSPITPIFDNNNSEQDTLSDCSNLNNNNNNAKEATPAQQRSPLNKRYKSVMIIDVINRYCPVEATPDPVEGKDAPAFRPVHMPRTSMIRQLSSEAGQNRLSSRPVGDKFNDMRKSSSVPASQTHLLVPTGHGSKRYEPQVPRKAIPPSPSSNRKVFTESIYAINDNNNSYLDSSKNHNDSFSCNTTLNTTDQQNVSTSFSKPPYSATTESNNYKNFSLLANSSTNSANSSMSNYYHNNNHNNMMGGRRGNRSHYYHNVAALSSQSLMNKTDMKGVSFSAGGKSGEQEQLRRETASGGGGGDGGGRPLTFKTGICVNPRPILAINDISTSSVEVKRQRNLTTTCSSSVTNNVSSANEKQLVSSNDDDNDDNEEDDEDNDVYMNVKNQLNEDGDTSSFQNCSSESAASSSSSSNGYVDQHMNICEEPGKIKRKKKKNMRKRNKSMPANGKYFSSSSAAVVAAAMNHSNENNDRDEDEDYVDPPPLPLLQHAKSVCYVFDERDIASYDLVSPVKKYGFESTKLTVAKMAATAPESDMCFDPNHHHHHKAQRQANNLVGENIDALLNNTTTDLDSILSSVSLNDYQLTLDCLNTNENSINNSSSSSSSSSSCNHERHGDMECGGAGAESKLSSHSEAEMNPDAPTDQVRLISHNFAAHPVCAICTVEFACDHQHHHNNNNNKCDAAASTDSEASSRENSESGRTSPASNFNENDVEPSAVACEFARADPLLTGTGALGGGGGSTEKNNTQLKSSDEDFTYSGVVASTSCNGDLLMLPKRPLAHDEHENSTAPQSNENNSLEAITENIQLLSFNKLSSGSPDKVATTEVGQENVVSKRTFNVIVHRLPGEKLGMNLRVAKDGRVLVVGVIDGGAADRASDPSGNSCPVKTKDEIAEINGVSLNNMTNEDLLTIVEELPLYVLLTIRRANPRRRSRAINEEDEDLEEEEENEEEENDEDANEEKNGAGDAKLATAPVSPMVGDLAKKTMDGVGSKAAATLNDDNVNNDEESCTSLSGHASPNTLPVGYTVHTVFLSSLESRCIMPNDLKDSTELEGHYKIQRNTLQIGGEEDFLQKGDILYNINGDSLAYKNKFDLISKLSSLGGIAEVTVLRKVPPNMPFGVVANSNCSSGVGGINRAGSAVNGCEIAGVARSGHRTSSEDAHNKIPYHNGIFAQNSIKLAMRRYEKPSMKCSSEVEFGSVVPNSGAVINASGCSGVGGASLPVSLSDASPACLLQTVAVSGSPPSSTHLLSPLQSQSAIYFHEQPPGSLKPGKTPLTAATLKFLKESKQPSEAMAFFLKMEQDQQQQQQHDSVASSHSKQAKKPCASEAAVKAAELKQPDESDQKDLQKESVTHDDNWVLCYDKRPPTHLSHVVDAAADCLGSAEKDLESKSVDESSSTLRKKIFSNAEQSDYSNTNAEANPHSAATSSSPTAPSFGSSSGGGGGGGEKKKKQQLKMATEHELVSGTNTEQVQYFYAEDVLTTTARTLTNSSCHSERSMVQLNCAVCYEDEETVANSSSSLSLNTATVTGCQVVVSSSAAAVQTAAAVSNRPRASNFAQTGTMSRILEAVTSSGAATTSSSQEDGCGDAESRAAQLTSYNNTNILLNTNENLISLDSNTTTTASASAAAAPGGVVQRNEETGELIIERENSTLSGDVTSSEPVAAAASIAPSVAFRKPEKAVKFDAHANLKTPTPTFEISSSISPAAQSTVQLNAPAPMMVTASTAGDDESADADDETVTESANKRTSRLASRVALPVTAESKTAASSSLFSKALLAPDLTSSSSTLPSIEDNKFVSTCRIQIHQPQKATSVQEFSNSIGSVPTTTRTDSELETVIAAPDFDKVKATIEGKTHRPHRPHDTVTSSGGGGACETAHKQPSSQRKKKIRCKKSRTQIYFSNDNEIRKIFNDGHITEASVDDDEDEEDEENAGGVPATSTTTLATMSISDDVNDDSHEIARSILNELVDKITAFSSSKMTSRPERKSVKFVSAPAEIVGNNNASTSDDESKETKRNADATLSGENDELDEDASNGSKFTDLKKFMHGELIQLIRGKENLNKLSDSSYVKSKLNTMIERIQNRIESDNDLHEEEQHLNATHLAAGEYAPSIDSSMPLSPPPAPPASTSFRVDDTTSQSFTSTINCCPMPTNQPASPHGITNSSSSTLKCLTSPPTPSLAGGTNTGSVPPPPAPPIPPGLLSSALLSKSNSKLKCSTSTSSFSYVPASQISHHPSKYATVSLDRNENQKIKDKMSLAAAVAAEAVSALEEKKSVKKPESQHAIPSEVAAAQSANTMPRSRLEEKNTKTFKPISSSIKEAPASERPRVEAQSTADTKTVEATSTTSITTTMKTTTTKLLRTESSPSSFTAASGHTLPIPAENIDLIKYAAASSSSLFSSSSSMLLDRFNSLVTARPFNNQATAAEPSVQDPAATARAQAKVTRKMSSSSFLNSLAAIESHIQQQPSSKQQPQSTASSPLASMHPKYSLNSRLKSIILAAAAAAAAASHGHAVDAKTLGPAAARVSINNPAFFNPSEPAADEQHHQQHTETSTAVTATTTVAGLIGCSNGPVSGQNAGSSTNESVIDYVESAFDKQIKQKTFGHSNASSSSAVAPGVGAVSSAIAAAVVDSSNLGPAGLALEVKPVAARTETTRTQSESVPAEDESTSEVRLRKKPFATTRASKSKSITELSLSLLNNAAGAGSSNTQPRKSVNFRETVVEIEKHQTSDQVEPEPVVESPPLAASVKEKIMLFTKPSKEESAAPKTAGAHHSSACLNTLKTSTNKVARPLSQVLVENASMTSTLIKNGLSSSHAKINTASCDASASSKQPLSAMSIAKKFTQPSMTSSTPSLFGHAGQMSLSATVQPRPNTNNVNNNREPLMLTSPCHNMSSSLVSSSATGLPPPAPTTQQSAPVYSSAYSSATSIIESQNQQQQQHQHKFLNMKDGSMRLHSSASTLNSNTFSSTTCTLTTVKNNNNNIRSQPSSAVSSGLSNIFNTNRNILGPNSTLDGAKKIVNFKQQNDKLIINIESRSSTNENMVNSSTNTLVSGAGDAEFGECGEDEENFKSVRDKIAYFSAKNASKMMRKSVGDLTSCLNSSANKRFSLMSNSATAAGNTGLEFLLNNNVLFNKMAERNLLRDPLEINSADLSSLGLKHGQPSPSNEPDQSSKNPFQAAIRTFIQQPPNTPCKLIIPNKSAGQAVGAHPSFSAAKRVVEPNASKLEIKNIIHTNENKISNMIQSIETKFKK